MTHFRVTKPNSRNFLGSMCHWSSRSYIFHQFWLIQIYRKIVMCKMAMKMSPKILQKKSVCISDLWTMVCTFSKQKNEKVPKWLSGIFQFLFRYGMEESRSTSYPNLRSQLSVHDLDHLKKGEEGNEENCWYLIFCRTDRDLLIKQCLLSGAGPRVSAACYTSVTDYLSCGNIIHDIEWRKLLISDILQNR